MSKTIFIFLFLLFFSSSSAFASQSLSLNANVPLSSEFTQLIIQNSTVTANQTYLKNGDILTVKVHLRASAETKLVNHRVKMIIIGYQEFESNSDTNSELTFAVPVNNFPLGKYRVKFIDLNYSSPIELKSGFSFVVYNPNNIFITYFKDILLHFPYVGS